MAVIHEERHDGRVYQIRTAGASVRLYTNGVFHSQFSTSRRAAASVWELLAMPSLIVERTRLAHVLVLGVGGGAVVRLLSERFGMPCITGIELDPVHLDLARRFFDLELPNVELVAADARRWVRDNPRRRFDLIIDDLFGESGGAPARAVAFDAAWMGTLAKLLTTHGALVANFGDLAEFRRSAMGIRPVDAGTWSAGHSLRIDTLENVVGVLSRTPSTLDEFSDAIGARFGERTRARLSVRNLSRAGRHARP